MRKVTQAPPWAVRLLTPFIARNVAIALREDHPTLSAGQLVERMRADLGPNPGASELKLLEAVRLRLAPPQAAASTGPGWRSPSALVLVGANLLPLYGVLFLGWEVFPVMLLFWLENVVLGVLNVARMLLADPGDAALWGAKLFMAPFFCVHYGMFTAGHGMFVFHLFGGEAFKGVVRGLNPLPGLELALRQDGGLLLAAAVLAASHLFSFGWNYLYRGEFRRAALKDLMTRPYARIVVLHLTIIFGGFAVMALGSPAWALLLLVALKIGIDLKAHLKEHRQ